MAGGRYLSTEYNIPILVLRDELSSLLESNPKPPPPVPPQSEAAPEPAPAAEGDEAGGEEAAAEAEAEAEAEPEAEPEPLVWQDHVSAYLNPAAPAEGEEEATEPPTLSDETFVEVVTMILKAEPFASQGYVW